MPQLWNSLEHPTVRFASGNSADVAPICEKRFRAQQTVDESHQQGKH